MSDAFEAEKPRENNKILGTHLGHQEVERVVGALDTIFEMLPPEQWMAVLPVSNLLCHELGYEDVQEFHDALQGEFADFLEVMPHIETREPEANEEGGLRFRMKELPAEEDRVPCKLVYRIENSEDLWRVFMKMPKCSLQIPELEFEISADGVRHVDCIYNHLASAIWNLGNHVRTEITEAPTEYKLKLMETATALNWLLDVEQPWTIVANCLDGCSVFKPEGVEEGKVIRILNPAENDPVGLENLGKFCADGPGGQAWMENAADNVQSVIPHMS